MPIDLNSSVIRAQFHCFNWKVGCSQLLYNIRIRRIMQPHNFTTRGPCKRVNKQRLISHYAPNTLWKPRIYVCKMLPLSSLIKHKYINNRLANSGQASLVTFGCEPQFIGHWEHMAFVFANRSRTVGFGSLNWVFSNFVKETTWIKTSCSYFFTDFL